MLRSTTALLLFLAMIDLAFQKPQKLLLPPLGFSTNKYLQGQDAGRSLTDEDFMNAQQDDFFQTENARDENRNPELFEGDIEIDKLGARSAVASEQYRWPKFDRLVVVPYVIPHELTDKTRLQRIAKVVLEFKSKTCVRLVKRTNEQHFVTIDPWPMVDGELAPKRCSSALGMRAFPQTIQFGSDCSFGSLLHEFMHALGFHHEHTRTDRDKYIRIFWDKLKTIDDGEWTSQFKLCSERRQGCNILNTGYDYESIMHYGDHIQGVKTMEPTHKGVVIGQRTHLSEKDIMGINEYYGCN